MENDQTLFLIGQTVLFDMVTDNTEIDAIKKIYAIKVLRIKKKKTLVIAK